MKKNKAGAITVVIIILLLLVIVVVDYIYDMNKMPKYEHGQIVSVTMNVRGGIDGRNILYSAYKTNDGYEFKYENTRMGVSKVFELSEDDYKKLIRNDFHELMKSKRPEFRGDDEIYIYTYLVFEDGWEKEIQNTDYSIVTFFRACYETFMDEGN